MDCVAFFGMMPQIWRNGKKSCMMKLKDKYEELGRMIEAGTVCGKSFPEVCRILNVPVSVLDEVLVSELGISGEEYFLKYC